MAQRSRARKGAKQCQWPEMTGKDAIKCNGTTSSQADSRPTQRMFHSRMAPAMDDPSNTIGRPHTYNDKVDEAEGVERTGETHGGGSVEVRPMMDRGLRMKLRSGGREKKRAMCGADVQNVVKMASLACHEAGEKEEMWRNWDEIILRSNAPKGEHYRTWTKTLKDGLSKCTAPYIPVVCNVAP